MNHSLAKIIRHLNHLTIKKKGANKNCDEVKDMLKALPQIKLNMQTYTSIMFIWTIVLMTCEAIKT